MTTKIKELPLLRLASIPVLDADGLSDDAMILNQLEWELTADTEDSATYDKGILRLRAAQDENNCHRLKWELLICQNGTTFGYANVTLRPGDMSLKVVVKLADEAVKVAEEEFQKWSVALAEAKKALS